jgi:A/G-specific adenine glycosylase
MNHTLHTKLKNWFSANKRDLPWRNTSDPYAIWISEIMLQQTRVNVVIPYFFRWMERFPTVHDLASASLEEVIKEWEGLGYYSRARNLHEGAKWVVNQCNGQIPNTEEELCKIKGLGPYTVGAILSFAFHKRASAVDGNVIRVLTRIFGIDKDIGKSSTVQFVRELASELLPEVDSWTFNEALIELGALVCQRKANCQQCPVQQQCVAFSRGLVNQLPVKIKKMKIEHISRMVAIIQSGSLFLVRKEKNRKIMSDLYEFPYFPFSESVLTSSLKEKVKMEFDLDVEEKEKMPQEKHSFTRYQVKLFPVLFACSERKEIPGWNWHSYEELLQLPFSSGHRRIFHSLPKV